jgi:Tol biopolymer transport system component
MAENATSISVARDSGAMAFAAAAYAPRILWYSLDPSGRQLTGSPVPLTGRDLLSSDADVTPDGLHLAFSVSRPLGSTVELRVKPLPDGVDRTIRTSNAARHEQRQRPRWSPDGQRIVFRYVHPQAEGAPKTHPLLAPQQLRLVNVGTGEESELTTTAPRLVTAGGFSADGKFVVASVGPLQQTVQTMSIVLLPLAAAPKADAQMKIVTTHVGKSGLLDPVMSPNGQWIAFGVQGQTARIAVVGSSDGLWNQPQPEGQWRYVDPIAMYDPRWSIDGTLLYFSSTQDGIANVWAVDFNPLTGDIGKPFQVTQFNGQGELMPLAPAMSAPARGGIAVRTGDPTGGIWLLRRKL